MRLLSLAMSAVLAAAAFATTAQANGVSVAYLGLRGSVVDTQDGNTTSGLINYDESYKTSFAAALFVGWVLDENFRLEAEAGYRSTDLDSIHVTRNTFDNTSVGLDVPISGHAQVDTFMANLYYDIHFLGDIGVLPWIGVGIGGAYIDYAASGDINANLVTTLSAKDHTSAFAYQLMAGITAPLADGISGSLGYRFFQTQDFNYVDDFGLSFQTKLSQQSIDIGLQFHI